MNSARAAAASSPCFPGGGSGFKALETASLPEGSLADRFLAPVLDQLPVARHTRDCPSLLDRQRMLCCLARVLDDQKSGRVFLQKFSVVADFFPVRFDFFESLNSPRRLALCAEFHDALLKSGTRTFRDRSAAIRQLAPFGLWAGYSHPSTAPPRCRRSAIASQGKRTRPARMLPVGRTARRSPRRVQGDPRL